MPPFTRAQRVTSVLAIASAAALGGCSSQVTLTDNVDFTWDFGLTLDRFDDELHDPYVRGANLRMYATSDDDDESYAGWELRSSDPSILLLEPASADGLSVTATGQALAAGDVTVTVLDSKAEVVGVADVHVRVPDRVELEAHGYLILDRDAQAGVDEIRVVEGGTATYLVRYFLGDVQLNGNGVLAASSDAPASSLVPVAETSHLFEDREWLQVTAGAAGSETLQLFADGAPVATVPVVTVPESDIVEVTIEAQDESRFDDGDWLVLLAQSVDAAGRRIFGVSYGWNIGGLPQYDVGDLYRYRLDGDIDTMVIAERGGHSASVMIHSGEGYVSSSNNVGCATASPTGWLMPLGAAAGLSLLAARARRRRSGHRGAAMP